ncbi:hypothetical protein JCM16303_004233 [Sporobolomyces ruberrimus]
MSGHSATESLPESLLHIVSMMVQTCMIKICMITDAATEDHPSGCGYYIYPYSCSRNDFHHLGHEDVQQGNGISLTRWRFSIPAIPMAAVRAPPHAFEPWMTYATNTEDVPKSYEKSFMAGPRWAGVVGFYNHPNRLRRGPSGMDTFLRNRYKASTSSNLFVNGHGLQSESLHEHRLLLDQLTEDGDPSATLNTGTHGAPRTVKYNGVYRCVDGRLEVCVAEHQFEFIATLDDPGPHQPQVRLQG